ncbi:nucleoporin NUP313 [Plasmodium yoelii yoelii]|uniref:Nucleoporin NUP313 n=2 Tax=Plasmodium yoelii TaxID=5861 RepID=A0AAF0B6U8_PLAYO|nr:nucleoporin NUP313 [Plasmodium yoelii yoelii]
MLKHYNYFSTDKYEDTNVENGNNNHSNNILNNNLKNKKHHQYMNNVDKGSNLKRIANCLETNCNNIKNDKINILKKICDKNLLYYINLQLKNIAHLLNYKEIEIACTYLNHIKNNLFVIFQIPILLFNVLYDKLIKSYNDFSIMDNYFNNSLLYKDFRYEYILKTKIAYMLLNKFNEQDDIENCIKFAIYFDNNRIKAHKNNIYNDYIFHKNLINSYINVHENIVPSEWIQAKYAKNGELNDMNDSEYLDYYSFFFKDISKYIKLSIIDKIINSNIFSLHKENYTICQSSEDREDTNKKYKSNNGTNVGNNSKFPNNNNTNENNETSQNDIEKKKNKFACYFMYMVRRSIMDDVVNIYSSKGEYFYKKLLTTLVNNNFTKDYEKSHNKHFHMFIQVANINIFMKNVFFEYINFFKKKELYNIEKIKNEDEIMDNLVNVVKVNGRNFFVVINTLAEIVTKIEKNIVKDVNIHILINLRNIIIDTFYLFKYVFNNREFSLSLIENLYRNVLNFNDTINSFFSDDVNFYPKEQIKDLYTHIRHKFTSQNVLN